MVGDRVTPPVGNAMLRGHRVLLSEAEAAGLMTRRPGPGRVSWRIHRERVAVLAWGRAVLLQLAHPLVAAGVAQHSEFGGPVRTNRARLHRTIQAMLSLIFGTGAEALATGAGIDALHGRIVGELGEPVGAYPADTIYGARMPDLLLWVHATLLESNLLVYERYVGSLTEAERDQYCQESRMLGPLLGFPPAAIPASRRELDRYMTRMYASGEIVVGPTARRVAGLLLRTSPAWPVRGPALTLLHLPTVGLLPPHIREGYRFRWRETHAWALDATSDLMRRRLPALPPIVRYWPVARQAERRARRQHAGLLAPADMPAPAPLTGSCPQVEAQP